MSVGSSQAALILFSFDNEDGVIAGTVSGTITLPDGDGTLAATSVIVDSAPSGLDFATGFDFAPGSLSNQFTVAGGSVTAADFFWPF